MELPAPNVNLAQAHPTPAIAGIWGVGQWMKVFCFYVCFSNKIKQRTKKTKIPILDDLTIEKQTGMT